MTYAALGALLVAAQWPIASTHGGVRQQGHQIAQGDVERPAPNDPLARAGTNLTRRHRALSNATAAAATVALARQALIPVDAVASGDASALLADLEGLGLLEAAVSGRLVSGLLPTGAIQQAAALGSLQFVRESVAVTRTGSVTSQGDSALHGNAARATHGVDGTGLTVGVLSDSYDCLGGAAGDVASGDLPAGVVVVQEGSCGLGLTDEGRAMMQLIADVAPGATLAFRTAWNGQADFAQGIQDLAAAGADVIVDDIGYVAAPMFQDGVIAQAVDSVVASGIPYFSAAGNSARTAYESTFVEAGFVVVGSTTYMAHDFDPGPGVDFYQTVTLPPGSTMLMSFQWDEPFFSVSGAPGSSSDLDIFLVNSDFTVTVAAGTSLNLGGDPVEVLLYTNPSGSGDSLFHLLIGHAQVGGGSIGPLPGLMKYIGFSSTFTVDEYATNSGTVFGHPNAGGAIAVGAANYLTTPQYGFSPPLLENYSSAGNTPILFDASGQRLGAPLVRQNPSIVAPDGTDNTFFGSDTDGNTFPNFFGTSAAAPHAAAVAALMLEARSSLTPAAVEAILEASAIDMDAAGFDSNTGFGLIQADAALNAVSSPEADLALIVLDSPDPSTAGQPLNHQTTVTNNGPIDATAVSVTATLPSDFTFDAVASDPGCSESGGVVTCNLGFLATGTAGSVDIVSDVGPSAVGGSVVTSFSVGGSETDPAPANNAASVTTAVDPALADVSQVPSTTTVNTGSTFTVDVHVLASAVQSVESAQTFVNFDPSVLQVQSIADGPIFATDWNDAALPGTGFDNVNGYADFIGGRGISGTAAAAPFTLATITFLAVSGDPATQLILNSTASPQRKTKVVDGALNVTGSLLGASVEVVPMADLSLALFDWPDPVADGGRLNYRAQVTHTSGLDATGVVVTHTLPAGVAVFDASSSDPSCSLVAESVVCNLGAVTAGSVVFADIAMTPVGSGHTIVNQASVSANETDPAPSDNTASVATAVSGVLELSLALFDWPDPVQVGQLLNYRAQVSNVGSVEATGVIVRQTLPAGITFDSVSSDPSCSESGGTATCTLGTVASSAVVFVDIAVIPQAGTEGTTLVNSASVSSNEADPAPGSSAAAAASTVSADSADLALSLFDGPDPVSPGQSLQYQAVIDNLGPGDASGVTLSLTLPASVTFDPGSSDPGCTESGGVVTCNHGALSSGGSVAIDVFVDVWAGTGGTTFVASASVSGNEGDAVPANNAVPALQTTVSGTQVDLSLSLFDAPDPVSPGSGLTYQALVTAVVFDATGIILTHTLPTGVTFDSIQSDPGCSESAGIVTCSLGALDEGQSTTVDVHVTVDSGLADGTELFNPATLVADQADFSPGNNAATVKTTVQVTDLSLAMFDWTDPVLAGSPLNIGVAVSNAGSGPATGVTLSITLPPGLTFDAGNSDARCSAGNPVTSGLGAIAGGGSDNVNIRANVDPLHASGSIFPTASVVLNEPDPTPGNNTASVKTTVVATPDLSITLFDWPDPVAAGGTLNLAAPIDNLGGAPGTNVVLTFMLPAGLTFNAGGSDARCSAVDGTVTCGLGAVASGGSDNVSILADVDAGLTSGTELFPSASIAADEAEANAGDNARTVKTTVQ